MIKKQRVTKYISILSVSLGIILVTLFSNTQEIRAYTNNSTPYTIESHMGEVNALHTELIVTINFADYYTGYITFTIYNISGQAVSYYAINTKLTNMTNTGFRTVVNQCKYAEVHIFYQTESTVQAAYNLGYITSATFGLFSTYLNTHWKTTTDVKNTSYSSSTLYVDNPVDDLLNEVTSIDTNIADIEDYVDLINDSVTSITTDVDSINSQLISLVDSIDDFQTYDVKTYQYSAFLIFENVADLQYNSDLALPVYHLPARDTFTLDEFFRVGNGEDMYFVYYMKTSYHNTFNYMTNNSNNGYYTNSWVLEAGWRLYYDNFSNTTGSTMYYTPINSVDYYILPVYYGPESAMPDEVRQLIGFSTKSESLLNRIINSITSGTSSIISALQNLNITVDDNTEINNVVNNKNTTINNVTNNHTTVNNITNDFTLDFDTANNAITFDSDIISNLTDTATFWNGKMSEVEVSLGNLHYPIVLGFILLALLAFIGG